MSDAIEVAGLRLLGRHGANLGEQAAEQPFEVDLLVEGDFAAAAATDELALALDYGPLVTTVRRIVEETHYRLLEALAARCCDELLVDERVAAVTITLRKLRPPLAADVRSVGVRLRRGRV